MYLTECKNTSILVDVKDCSISPVNTCKWKGYVDVASLDRKLGYISLAVGRCVCVECMMAVTYQLRSTDVIV